ncbi:hypothetical protein [Acidovorax sp. BoFeN1]|uniref:hypothetical protein n=1 Tax=Acidovorax sp. BoFeN1 TaxID=1231053 RepID=UPI0011C07C4F|nr:hypothetical protein [Acidovorax sp. BoFeN1]
MNVTVPRVDLAAALLEVFVHRHKALRAKTERTMTTPTRATSKTKSAAKKPTNPPRMGMPARAEVKWGNQPQTAAKHSTKKNHIHPPRQPP